MADVGQASVFRVGLIADIQYADAEDGADFEGTEERRYRNALKIAGRAVQSWNQIGVEAIVQLGDIIDGVNAKAGASKDALANVISILDQCRAPARYDLIGNHELYNIKRTDLCDSGLQCLGPNGKTYYSVSLTPLWEAVILDPYELALIGMSSDEPGYQQAVQLIKEKNPAVLAADGQDWFAGLSKDLHRYVPYNGGLSTEQVKWLDCTLDEISRAQKKALIFTHVPIYQPATKAKTVVWNLEEVLDVIWQYEDTVSAVLAGHDHAGGYAVDSHGLHHITMNSPLTAPPGHDCWAVLELHESGIARFVAHGRACVESNTGGTGRVFRELLLVKGAGNAPEEGSELQSVDK